MQYFKHYIVLIMGSCFFFISGCIANKALLSESIRDPIKSTHCYPPNDPVGSYGQIHNEIPCKIFFFSSSSKTIRKNSPEKHIAVSLYFDLFKKKIVDLKQIAGWLNGGKHSNRFDSSETWKSCVLTGSKVNELGGACLEGELLVVFSSLPNLNNSSTATTIADLERLVFLDNHKYRSDQSKDLFDFAKSIENGLQNVNIPYEARGLTITFFHGEK